MSILHRWTSQPRFDVHAILVNIKYVPLYSRQYIACHYCCTKPPHFEIGNDMTLDKRCGSHNVIGSYLVIEVKDNDVHILFLSTFFSCQIIGMNTFIQLVRWSPRIAVRCRRTQNSCILRQRIRDAKRQPDHIHKKHTRSEFTFIQLPTATVCKTYFLLSIIHSFHSHTSSIKILPYPHTSTGNINMSFNQKRAVFYRCIHMSIFVHQSNQQANVTIHTYLQSAHKSVLSRHSSPSLLTVDQEVLDLDFHPAVRKVPFIPLPRELAPIDWAIPCRVIRGAQFRNRFVNCVVRGTQEERNREPRLGLVHHHPMVHTLVLSIAPDLRIAVLSVQTSMQVSVRVSVRLPMQITVQKSDWQWLHTPLCLSPFWCEDQSCRFPKSHVPSAFPVLSSILYTRLCVKCHHQTHLNDVPDIDDEGSLFRWHPHPVLVSPTPLLPPHLQSPHVVLYEDGQRSWVSMATHSQRDTWREIMMPSSQNSEMTRYFLTTIIHYWSWNDIFTTNLNDEIMKECGKAEMKQCGNAFLEQWKKWNDEIII